MPLSLLGALTLAGSLLIQTSVPAEVHLDGAKVFESFEATHASLPDVPAGPHQIVVYRDGVGRKLDVEVPREGVLRVLVGAESLDTDQAAARPASATPRVELRAAAGQSFALILDGARTTNLSSKAPLTLDQLTPGEHTFELRSANMQTIWVRGTLLLKAGDDLIIRAAEGRMIEVFGRDSAWVPEGADGNGDAAPPPGPAPAPKGG